MKSQGISFQTKSGHPEERKLIFWYTLLTKGLKQANMVWQKTNLNPHIYYYYVSWAIFNHFEDHRRNSY